MGVYLCFVLEQDICVIIFYEFNFNTIRGILHIIVHSDILRIRYGLIVEYMII